MQAALLRGVGEDLALEEVEVAEPQAGEVLVRVKATGICRTDHSMQQGSGLQDFPVVLGHEAAGIVEAVGPGVTYVTPGDPVVGCASAFCGECEWCMRGHPQHCDDKRRSRAPGASPRLSQGGVTVHPFVGLGSFAEQMLVHERTLAKLPPEMPLDRAALIGCSVLTGFGGVINRAQVQANQTVAIIGCGGVGLNAVQAARIAGAVRIIAIDRMPEKLRQAEVFGATDVVDASEVDPVEAVQHLTRGGVDHAIEVVGRPETIEQAFRMCRPRGTTTVIGVTRPWDAVTLPALEFMLEKRIQGSKMGSSRFRLDVDLVSNLYLQGRLRLDELLSRTIALEDINAAMNGFDEFAGARTVVAFD